MAEELAPVQNVAPDQPEAAEPPTPVTQPVSWTAPEFVAHDKSAGWFLALAVVAVVFASVIFLITKDVVSTVVILVVAAVFGVYGRHQPRELTYSLDHSGINIGNKFHNYEEFKSFSVKPEGSLLSLTFTPLKRFAPYLTIYYPQPEEEKIMAVMASRLPYEEPRRDAVDSLMRRIRF